MSTSERVTYVRVQVLALVAELYEALDEVSWKTWTTGTPRLNQRRFGEELIDAQHFLINLFLVAGWDATAVHEHFMKKNRVNHERQDSGAYDGISTKCANQACRRALDEPGAGAPVTRHEHDDLAWCNDLCYDVWTSHRELT